jgi:O-antigen ligase
LVYPSLLVAFLATMAIDWPPLPFNARLTDLIFILVALVTVAQSREGGLRTEVRPYTYLYPLDYAVVIYLAGSVVAAMASPAPSDGLVEIIRESYLVVMYLVIAIAVQRGFAQTVATGVALSGALPATIGLLTLVLLTAVGMQLPAIGPVMTLPYIGETLRLRALTASEAMLACVLAIAVPFALLHPWVRATTRRLVAVAATLGAAAAWTFSHSVAGVAVAALVAAWPSLHSRWLRTSAAIAALAVVLGLNFAATISIRAVSGATLRDDSAYHYAVDDGRVIVGGLDVEYQTMSYFRLKQVALDAFLRHPLTGLGLDRFHAATELAFQQGRLTAPYRNIDPHSTFLGRLAETGLIGGISLLVLWIAIALHATQLSNTAASDSWVMRAIIAALAGTLVNSLNADVMNFRFLWVVLGLMRGLSWRGF